MSRRWSNLLFLFWLWNFAPHAQGSDPFITPQDVAASFRYDGDLELRDVTQSNRSSNQGVIWSGHFTASDNTFAPATITVAAGRSILTPDLARRLGGITRLDPAPAQRAAAPPLAKAITLSNGAEGFVFQSGMGPGGFGYSAVATTADGAFDVAISLNFSSSAPIEKTARTGPYYEAIMNNGAASVPSILEETIPRVFAFVEPRLRDTTAGNQNAVALPPALTPTTAIISTETPAASSSPASPAEKYQNRFQGFALWITVFTVATVSVGVWLFRGRKGRMPSRNVK